MLKSTLCPLIVLGTIALVACSSAKGTPSSEDGGNDGATDGARTADSGTSPGTDGATGTDSAAGTDSTAGSDSGNTGAWVDRTPKPAAAALLDWASVASDSTGTYLVAAVGAGPAGGGGGDIWTSTNAGVTWTDQTSSGAAHDRVWSSVGSDSTGTRLVAVEEGPAGGTGGDIWTSTNAGVTWTDRTSSGAAHGLTWSSVASDSTGTHLVAVVGPPAGGGSGGDIWTSTNAGVTWTDQTPSPSPASGQGWYSVASDSTGTHLVAVSNGLGGDPVQQIGDVWTSTNAGVTWTDQTTSGAAHGQPWVSVASDSTGTHLVAVAGGGDSGDIWTSTNAGVTWTDQTPSPNPASGQSWYSVASDSTGTHLVAVVSGPNFSGGGDIWTSTNAGVTWTDQTPSGAVHDQPWSCVASDSTGTHLVAVVQGGDIWTN